MPTIANGKITIGKLYYFKNKAFPNFALNVWCSSKYPADELSNVCLWKFDKTDAAQKWYVRGNDSQCRICPLVGSSSLCLDRYTGTKEGAGINAHLYSYSNTAAFIITDGTCSDTVRIRAIEGGKFLTAYSGANGSKDGRTATSAGNVYFASSALGNLKQEWVPIEVTSSSGGETSNKNYVTYPCSYMKILQSPFALTSGNSNSHYYYSDASANYHDYPIDEACEDKNRSWFYCPCDEMEIKRIYGVGESGKTNTIWLRSTSKVKMPCGEDYLVLMVMHPEDDDLEALSVGQKFKRGETIFREGMNGNATGNHFHMSAGKGDLSSNGWRENTNGRWVLTTTNGTIEPQEAFYVDKDFTTENNNGGISFTYLPE